MAVKKSIEGICLCVCWLLAAAAPGADAPSRSADGVLSAVEFLEAAREPFQRDAWGRFAGTVIHVGARGKYKVPMTLETLFSRESFRARVVLDNDNTYRLNGRHGGSGADAVHLELPEDEKVPGLRDMGIEPEDVTMSFISWEFVRELPRESVRRQRCRVMELKHPSDELRVRVFFSESYRFPLRVEWHRPQEEKPWRQLELKGVKKQTNGLWFMKTVILRGEGWKTQIRFDDAELYAAGEGPSPPEWMAVPGVPQPE